MFVPELRGTGDQTKLSIRLSQQGEDRLYHSPLSLTSQPLDGPRRIISVDCVTSLRQPFFALQLLSMFVPSGEGIEHRMGLVPVHRVLLRSH